MQSRKIPCWNIAWKITVGLLPFYIKTDFQNATDETPNVTDVTQSLFHIYKAQLCRIA